MTSYKITRRAFSDTEIIAELTREGREGMRFMPATHSARMLSDPVGEGFVMMRPLYEFWKNYYRAEQWLIRFQSEGDFAVFRLAWSDVIESIEEVEDA